MSIGDFIKRKRLERGLSLRQLAMYADVSHSYLSQVEANKFKPHPDWLKKLAKALKIDSDILMEQAGFIADNSKSKPWWQEEIISEKLTGGHIVKFPIGPKTVLPIIGIVPAKDLKKAFEKPVGDTPYIDQSDFAIQIKGNSLVEAGILDKDICYIKKQSHAKAGDLVLAVMGNEVVLGFFAKKGKAIIIEPANKKCQSMSSTQVDIIGIKIAILRR